MFAGVAEKSQHLGAADRGQYRQVSGAAAGNRDARGRRRGDGEEAQKNPDRGDAARKRARTREPNFRGKRRHSVLKSAIEREGDQTSFARIEIISPCRTAALWFLWHVTEPQYRLVFVYVMSCRAAKTYE